MSTRRTLSMNTPKFPLDSPNIDKVPLERRDPAVPQYHFYEEAFEKDGSVYLEMAGAEFDANNTGIMVKIPKEVWNRIVKIGER